jgi:nucleotide-binding universal stress UspA family protein
MRIGDILVLLDPTPAGMNRLDAACQLAARHGAHLVGLRCADPLSRVMLHADPSAGMLVAELLDRLRAEAREKAAELEAAFLAATARAGVAAEWRLVEGSALDHIALHARYADLVLLGQPDPARSRPGMDAVIEEALFASGRPVLVLPHGAGALPARRVLLGWNASREATRAAHDALPILAAADAVLVFAANPGRGINGIGDLPGADIARHLARHGAKVEVRQGSSDDLAAGDLLLNEASDWGADLIVMGGYGHSRWREMVLGGVTRSLMRQMTVPVLMSH